MLQKLKDSLVSRGADSRLTQMALSLHGRRLGYTVDFSDPTRIWLEKDNRRLALARRDVTFVPIMMEVIDLFFDSISRYHAVREGDDLDFVLQPAFHTYKRSGMGFYFPSIPEEDPLDQYFRYWYAPQPGDVVRDAGDDILGRDHLPGGGDGDADRLHLCV